MKTTKSNMFTCNDCKVDTSEIDEYYMLKDDIWATIAKPNEDLCIGCLEERLRRKLNRADFFDCLLNGGGGFRQSSRLINRLSRPAKPNEKTPKSSQICETNSQLVTNEKNKGKEKGLFANVCDKSTDNYTLGTDYAHT